MSDGNTQELKLHIVSDADTKGFTQMAAAGKELDSSMGVVRVSGADVEKILGKTGEAAQLSQRQTRLLAHVLGSEFPGGAAIAESAFSMMEGSEAAMMGSTFLLIAGLEMLRSAVEKINEEKKQAQKITDGAIETDAKHSEIIDKQREAFEQAEVAEESFHHNLERNTLDAVDSAAKLAKALYDAHKTAFEAGEDKRQGAAEGEIEAMEQRGVISHATAVRLKEQIDEEYHARKVAMMLAEDRMETAQLQLQLGNKKIEAQNDVPAEAAAASKYQSAAAAKAKNQTVISEAQGKINDAQNRINDLRETGVTEDNIQKLRASYEQTSGLPGQGAGAASLADQFHYLSTHFGGIVPRDLFGPQGDVNLANYEGAQADISGNKKIIAQAQARQTGIDAAADDAKSDLDSAREKLKKDRADVADLQEKISTKKQTDGIKEGAAAQDLATGNASDELGIDRGIADKVTNGQSTGDGDQQRLIAAASRIAGHQVDLSTAAQIIENGANNLGTFMAQLQKLAASFANIPNFKQRLDAMQAQLNSVTQVTR